MARRSAETLRTRILDAAVALLGEIGPRGLTQPRVARRAGIPQGHLTYYFPRKSDLLAAVARRIHEDTERDLVRIASPASAAGFLTGIIADARRSRMLLGLLLASEDDERLRQSLRAMADEVRPMIALLLRCEPEDPTVDLVLALTWGLQVQQRLYRRGPRQVARLVAGLIESFGGAASGAPMAPSPPPRGRRTRKGDRP